MKKGVVLLLSMIMASTFAGCGSNNSTGSTGSTGATTVANEHSQSSSEDNTVEPEPKTTQEKSGTIGDFTVSIENGEITTSKNGKKALLVAYSFKNGSDKTVKFADVLSAEAYQNNTACLQAGMENQDYDIETMLTELKPGETKNVYEAYLLQDDSEVTIRVCKAGQTADQEQNDTNMITRTFNVK